MKKEGKKGKVYIVGAGPGDPDLITLKGARCLREADVILYDRLISRSLLKYKKPNARLKYVGKTKSAHAMKQEKINSLLLKYAKSKKAVVRLKGGDPFILGRGSEEVLFLASHGFPCEVIPGVSSFYAVPEVCGIPLTHRGIASDFIVVTGHEDPSKGKSDINWKHIAKFKGTVVILMGKSNLMQIVRVLIKNGLKSTTPCAVIHRGSTKQQKVVYGNARNIVEKSKQLSAPSIVVIGDVVNLRTSNKPLSGKRYLATSSAHLNKDIAREFEAKGGSVDCVPMVKISPNKDCSLLDSIIANIKSYDWLVFTSRHGVMHFLRRFYHLKGNKKDLKGRIACVGCGTADEFKKNKITPSLIPDKFTTRNLAIALRQRGVSKRKVALLRTKLKKDPLKDMLSQSGAKITECIVYNIAKIRNLGGLNEAIAKEPNGLLFLSPGSVENFFDLVPNKTKNRLKKKSKFFSIGPVTTRSLRAKNINTIYSPKEHTIKGLLNACIKEEAIKYAPQRH